LRKISKNKLLSAGIRKFAISTVFNDRIENKIGKNIGKRCQFDVKKFSVTLNLRKKNARFKLNNPLKFQKKSID